MKPGKPISIVRPLVPAAGRIRTVRVAPVPMIWRPRRRRGDAVSILRAAQPAPAPAPVNVSVSLNMVWPACPPAAVAPATMFERVIRQIFGARRDGPRIETNRLLRLVETVWRTGPGAASLPPPPPSRRPRSTISGLDPGVRPSRSHPRRRTVDDTASPGSRPWASRPSRTAVRPDLGRRAAGRLIAARPSALRLPLASVDPATAPPPAPTLRIASRFPSRAARASSPRESTARPPKPEAGPVATMWRQAGRAGPRLAVAPSEPFFAGSAVPPSWRPRTTLVWRDPPPDEDGRETAARVNRSMPASSPGPAVFGVAPPMSAAAAAPAPAPAQGPDMGRLVEEVVRRLERIGRDERLRRGL